MANLNPNELWATPLTLSRQLLPDCPLFEKPLQFAHRHKSPPPNGDDSKLTDDVPFKVTSAYSQTLGRLGDRKRQPSRVLRGSGRTARVLLDDPALMQLRIPAGASTQFAHSSARSAIPAAYGPFSLQIVPCTRLRRREQSPRRRAARKLAAASTVLVPSRSATAPVSIQPSRCILHRSSSKATRARAAVTPFVSSSVLRLGATISMWPRSSPLGANLRRR
jgi:hypothetical protein